MLRLRPGGFERGRTLSFRLPNCGSLAPFPFSALLTLRAPSRFDVLETGRHRLDFLAHFTESLQLAVHVKPRRALMRVARGTTCGRSYTKSSHLSAMQETGEPFLRSPLLARVLSSENSTAFVSNVCMKSFKAVQLMSARASPSAGRPSGILADNPEGSDGASEGGPTLMQGIPSKGSASSPAACWRRRVHARARTRARTPSRPRDVSAAGGSAGRRYGRLTKKENPRRKRAKGRCRISARV